MDDFLLDWPFKDDSVDFVYMRWLVGCVTDWEEHCKKAYKCLKPSGWIESFDANGYYTSDDGTVTSDSAIQKYGEIFRTAVQKLRLPTSFFVVRDHLQRKAMEAAGFVNIHEMSIKVRILLPWQD